MPRKFTFRLNLSHNLNKVENENEEEERSMNSKKATALGLVLALGMSVSACAGKEEAVQETEESVAVEVQTPKIGSLTLDTAYIGTVMPQEQVYVIPKTSGTVTETFFEVGDQVQA